MAAVIRIKRSVGTAAPGSLKTGELAYSYGAGTENNLGDRLFFGKGDDGNGDATSVVVIGGEYFTNMLDHAPGTLTARSAITTDSANKIDILNVDNVTINGNTISTTNVDGNLVLDPNGSGVVDVNSSKISNVTDPTSDQDAATKKYVDDQNAAQTLTFTGDQGPGGSLVLADSSLIFDGTAQIGTNANNNIISIFLQPTGVDSGSYGTATLIPKFYVTRYGQIDSAGTVAVDGISAISFDSASGVVTIQTPAGVNRTASIFSQELTRASISAGTGITYDSATGVVSITNTGVSQGTYGSATLIPVLTVNAQGQITNATTASVATTLNISGDTGTASVDLLDSSLSITTGSGIVATASGNQVKLTLDSSAAVVFGTMEIVNGLVVGGDLQINGTTTTVNTTSLEVTDNMIYLNAGESDGSPTQFVDVGFAGNVNDTGTYEHVGFFRDATDGVWKLYQGYTPEPDSAPQIDTSHPSFAYAPLRVSTITGVYVGFDSDFSGKSTTDLTEGTNLYYTTARADSDAKNAVSAGTGISYNPTTGVITSNDGQIVHDNLSGFVANEHIDHSTITLTAGRGLAGGGDITASRSFNIDSAEFGDYFLSKQFLAGEGIDLTIDVSNKITVAAELATITNPGVASFDSDQFTVSSGAVTISVVDGGTY